MDGDPYWQMVDKDDGDSWIYLLKEDQVYYLYSSNLRYCG